MLIFNEVIIERIFILIKLTRLFLDIPTTLGNSHCIRAATNTSFKAPDIRMPYSLQSYIVFSQIFVKRMKNCLMNKVHYAILSNSLSLVWSLPHALL